MEFLHWVGLWWTRGLLAISLLGHVVLGIVTTQTPTVVSTSSPTSFVLSNQTTPKNATTTELFPNAAAKNTPPPTPTVAAAITKPAPVAAAPATPPAATAPVYVPQTPSLSSGQVDVQTRAALVNILCTTKASGYFDPLSGSGVIIDSRGVILTNAHVAQYFLLRDYPTAGNVSCVVRTGDPAEPKYTAELLYLPPLWIQANASEIGTQKPTGTGENDYAFLLITGTTDGSPLPATFPTLTMTTDEASDNEPVLLAAYPAEFLDGNTIQMDLYIDSATTQIDQLFSFASSTVDLISVGGTVVSQEGSSGGAVARLNDGALTAIIVTEEGGPTTSSRDLRAITLAHVDRSLSSEGQGGIASLLTGDLNQKATTFNATIALQEQAALTAVLSK